MLNIYSIFHLAAKVLFTYLPAGTFHHVADKCNDIAGEDLDKAKLNKAIISPASTIMYYCILLLTSIDTKINHLGTWHYSRLHFCNFETCKLIL